FSTLFRCSLVTPRRTTCPRLPYTTLFRSGDREKLSAETLKDIEAEFAAALGLQDHQRVAGTHINTDNFHMHVAYNLVNPRTLKRSEEHTSELQSRENLVCRLLLEKKKYKY